jgi:hypothetical protein
MMAATPLMPVNDLISAFILTITFGSFSGQRVHEWQES